MSIPPGIGGWSCSCFGASAIITSFPSRRQRHSLFHCGASVVPYTLMHSFGGMG
jgi:hypothetical protein